MSLVCYLLALVSVAAGFRISPNGIRVINGQEAHLGQFPYHVGVVGINVTTPSFNLCSGAIISQKWIVTTAYCLYNVDVAGYHAGSIDNSGNDGVVNSMDYEYVTLHPNFNIDTLENNIALMELLEPLEFGENINSIALSDSPVVADLTAIVTGFGHSNSDDGPNGTNILQWANVDIMQNSECAKIYGEEVVSEGVLCTKGSAGPCYGDAGGPLAQDDEDGTVLIGLFSFISATGCEGYPGGYVRIDYYRDWIEKITGI